MTNRDTNNIDFITGAHYPLQTYGWSGTQVGASSNVLKNSKMLMDGPPMVVSSQPPGCFAIDDDTWKTTFGASHDCVLGIFNGEFFKRDKDKIVHDEDTVWRDAIGTADQNIYEVLDISDEGIQQISYVISKDTVEEAYGPSTYDTFGSVEEARSIAMRIPLMAVGWGRTVGMRPTDPDPEDVNKRKNDDEHKLARETWKHGPIDVRWDERRGVWAAWNDLIADWTEEKRLGTLVFDTNKSASCGFPYIKGKLEDAWKVIKTAEFKDSSGKDADDQQSAEVCTHLEHNWAKFDDGSWKYAPLNTAFTIHRVGDAPITVTCGDETSQDAVAIEILTSVWFHMSPNNKDGPICFTGQKIEDEDLVGCMKYQGDPGKGQWVPTVPFDPCERAGFEFGICFDNDVKLAEAIEEVCCLVLELHGFLNPNGDPDKLKKAGGSSGAAGKAAKSASDALKSDPGGSQTLNDLNKKAQEAYDASQKAQNKSKQSCNQAAEAAETANTAGSKYANDASAVEDAQKAFDAAGGDAALNSNDPSTRQKAQKAQSDLRKAEETAKKSAEDYNNAAAEANKAMEKAKKDGQEADAAGDAAKAAGDEYSKQYDAEKGDGKPPPETPPSQDEMDAADKAADQAKKDRKDADVGEDEPTAEETAQEAKDCCEEAKAQIAKLAEDTSEAITKGMDSVSENVQDTLESVVEQINNAIGAINDALVNTLGETVTRADLVETPSVTQDSGGDGGPENPGGGGTDTGGSRPRGGGSTGGSEPRGGGDGGGAVDTPGGVVTPDQTKIPNCPIIRIKDPCAPGIPHAFTCPPGGGQGRGAGQKGTQREPDSEGGVDDNGNIIGQGNDAGKKPGINPGWYFPGQSDGAVGT